MLALAILAGVLPVATFASVPLGASNVQIGGFFSQGYIYSDGNNYPFTDNGGTFDFREMGFNASGTVGAHLRIGAQLFAQRLGNYGDDKVKLDWAVADYNFSQQFGVRVGRIKYPKGLYGEALDLDVIRASIFLPISLYNPVLRDFNSSLNGAMIYGSFDAHKAGTFDYKVFYGKIAMNPEQGVADFFNSSGLYASAGVRDLHMDSTDGVQVFWNTPVTGLKTGISYSALNKLAVIGPFAAYPAADVTLETDRYNTTTLSVEYVHEAWTFAGEWQDVRGNFSVVTPFGMSASPSRTANWYVSAARRFLEKFEAGASFAAQRESNAPPGTPDSAQHNKDFALCLRYDVNEHLTFKIEGHAIDGTLLMFNTPRTPNPILDTHTSFFAAKTTLSF